jgi:predicted ATPase
LIIIDNCEHVVSAAAATAEAMLKAARQLATLAIAGSRCEPKANGCCVCHR